MKRRVGKMGKNEVRNRGRREEYGRAKLRGRRRDGERRDGRESMSSNALGFRNYCRGTP